MWIQDMPRGRDLEFGKCEMGSSHAGQESRAILVTVVTSCMLNEKNVIKGIPFSRASRKPPHEYSDRTCVMQL